jgi:nucleoside-triphosphatase
MPNNYFLTGLPKAGKTTVLQQLAAELKRRKKRVGGFLSPEITEHGTRKGFYVEDIATGKRALLAEVGAGGPRVGKYHVQVKGFESVALAPLQDCERYDVLIIDEIGTMELESEKFGDALADALEHNVPIVASLHRKYLNDYRGRGSVYTLTETNRGELFLELLDAVGTPKQKIVKRTKTAKTKTAKPRRRKMRKKRKQPTAGRKRAPPKKTKKNGILHCLKRILRI